jgi:hypothetical protein
MELLEDHLDEHELVSFVDPLAEVVERLGAALAGEKIVACTFELDGVTITATRA